MADLLHMSDDDLLHLSMGDLSSMSIDSKLIVTFTSVTCMAGGVTTAEASVFQFEFGFDTTAGGAAIETVGLSYVIESYAGSALVETSSLGFTIESSAGGADGMINSVIEPATIGG